MDEKAREARSEWHKRHTGCCGTCKFKENDTCVNVDSDKLADTVTDEDHCSDWRKRK